MSILKNNSIFLKNGITYNPKDKKEIKQSILIESGKISKIGGQIEGINSDKTLVIDCSKKMICPGFVDINSNLDFFGRPDRETIESATLSAMSGGYTRVCVSPLQGKTLDNPEVVLAFLDKVSKSPIEFLPFGAATKDCQGSELSEIGMMFDRGIIGVSNGDSKLENTLMLRYIIEYLKSYDLPLMHLCYDKFLADNTFMNEGVISMKMGVSAEPYISELVDAYRVLMLASFLKGRIHLSSVTSIETIKLLENFSNEDFLPTFDIPVYNLFYSDHDLINFDTNLKSNTFFRDDSNRKEIVKWLKDGRIKCISSNHTPLSSDEKEKDFYSSLNGFISLQTSFSLACKSINANKKNIKGLIDCFTIGPLEILNLPLSFFEEKQKANLTIIDLDNEWQFNKDNCFSNSYNTPLDKMKFPVSIIGTISGNSIYLK